MHLYSVHLIKITNGVWLPKKKKHHTITHLDGSHDNCFPIEDRSFWFRHRNNCIVTLVKNNPPNGTLFDIGGGNGYVTSFLNTNGLKSILVEPNPIRIGNAVTRGTPLCIQSTVEEAKFNNNSLPAIGIFDVLEHVKNDVGFLRKLYDLLEPRGNIYITIPALNFLWSAQDVYARHFHRYTQKEIITILESLHFVIDYFSYYFSLFPLPIFLFRSLPYRFGLSNKYTTKQFQKEMTSSFCQFNPLIQTIFNWEVTKIRKKTRIPIGSSILIAAHKIP